MRPLRRAKLCRLRGQLRSRSVVHLSCGAFPDAPPGFHVCVLNQTMQCHLVWPNHASASCPSSGEIRWNHASTAGSRVTAELNLKSAFIEVDSMSATSMDLWLQRRKSGKPVNTPGVARIMITLQLIRALFLRPFQQGVAVLPEIQARHRVATAVRNARNPGPDNTPDSGQGRELWRDLGEAG